MSQEATDIMGDGWVWWQCGIYFRLQGFREDCWSNLPVGGLSLWLRLGGKVRPRDCAVHLKVWSLASWCSLCSTSLWLREPLKLQRMGGFGGRLGHVDFRVQWRVLGQFACQSLALVLEAGVGGTRVLPWGLGPKDWVVQLRGYLLTSGPLYAVTVCFLWSHWGHKGWVGLGAEFIKGILNLTLVTTVSYKCDIFHKMFCSHHALCLFLKSNVYPIVFLFLFV